MFVIIISSISSMLGLQYQPISRMLILLDSGMGQNVTHNEWFNKTLTLYA